MIFKRIGMFCFALGFLLAIIVFTNYGSDLIPKYYAKTGIIVFGGIALLMNLLALRFDPASENNIIFWVGTAAIYAGLILKMKGFYFNRMILLGGILVVAFSYFYNPFARKDTTQEDELLDQ